MGTERGRQIRSLEGRCASLHDQFPAIGPALPGQDGWVLPAPSPSDLAIPLPVIMVTAPSGVETHPPLQSTDFFTLLTSEPILKWKANKEMKWADSFAQS